MKWYDDNMSNSTQQMGDATRKAYEVAANRLNRHFGHMTEAAACDDARLPSYTTQVTNTRKEIALIEAGRLVHVYLPDAPAGEFLLLNGLPPHSIALSGEVGFDPEDKAAWERALFLNELLGRDRSTLSYLFQCMFSCLLPPRLEMANRLLKECTP